MLADPVHGHGRTFLVVQRVGDRDGVREDVARTLEVHSVVRGHELRDVLTHVVHFG